MGACGVHLGESHIVLVSTLLTDNIGRRLRSLRAFNQEARLLLQAERNEMRQMYPRPPSLCAHQCAAADRSASRRLRTHLQTMPNWDSHRTRHEADSQ